MKSSEKLASTSCRLMQLWIVPRGKDPSRDQERGKTRAKGRAKES